MPFPADPPRRSAPEPGAPTLAPPGRARWECPAAASSRWPSECTRGGQARPCSASRATCERDPQEKRQRRRSRSSGSSPRPAPPLPCCAAPVPTPPEETTGLRPCHTTDESAVRVPAWRGDAACPGVPAPSLRAFSVCLSTYNHLLCFRPFQAWNNAAQKPQRRFAPRALPRFIATIAPSDSCPGPDRFRLCLGEATGGHAVRLRVAPAPRQVSRVALSFCPAGTAKPSGPSRRPRRSPMPFAPVARHAVSTFVRCAKTRPAE